MVKASRFNLPKRIGGVKIPRKVRKSPLGRLLASPDGQRMVAATLLAASDAAGPAERSQAARPADQLAYALGEAGRTFVDAIRRADPAAASQDRPAWAAEPPDAPTPRPTGAPGYDALPH